MSGLADARAPLAHSIFPGIPIGTPSASNSIRTISEMVDWGLKRTINSADDVSFELKNSFLYHTRISYYTKGIPGRRRGKARSWSALIGKEATCVTLTRDTSRSELAINRSHVRGPNMSEPTACCR